MNSQCNGLSHLANLGQGRKVQLNGLSERRLSFQLMRLDLFRVVDVLSSCVFKNIHIIYIFQTKKGIF